MIDITPMCEDDLLDVVGIERLCFGDRWTVASFKNELDNPSGHYFTLRVDGEVAGYAGYWLILEEAHITTIAVHPMYQRKHLGERMLLALIEDAASHAAKWVTLEVRVSNVGAQKLYEKYGFQGLGRRRGYYQDDGEDALVMWTENIWDDEYRDRLDELRRQLEQTPV